MKVGLAYDLRVDYLAMGYSRQETAEFDREETILAIESALQGMGHATDRIGNAWKLTERLVRGDRWDLVFNIAEGLHGIAREAQVPAILDLYQIPYTFSDPVVMGLTLHKGMTKHVVRGHGFPSPDFMVAESATDTEKIDFAPPYFVKPVAEGTGKGISGQSIVRNKDQLAEVCETLINTFQQPALVEQYLSGREFTVGIVGTGNDARILGTMEVILLENAEKGGYSYENKDKYEDRVEYRLVKSEDDPSVAEAEKIALGTWRALGCRDGGRTDLRCDSEGKPYFLEVNPLAGLNPEHSDLPILCRHLGLPYNELIGEIFLSAAKRVDRTARKS
ncbi:MAG: ATP-grasp domain-containing protein [Desulfobacteraceae bacterium]|nr:MAG: ATP-grasp domain-containing protein [Desulfobacteraceae bacterium]